MHRLKILPVLVLSLFVTLPVDAQTDLSRFPLARAAVADAYIVVAARHNPERAFLERYWADVGQAFVDSGICTDIWDMIGDNVPDDALDEFEDASEKFLDLAESVDWADMFKQEFVYAGRFTTFPGQGDPNLVSEGVMLGRLESAIQAQENYDAMRTLMQEIAKLITGQWEDSSVLASEEKVAGTPVTSLRIGKVFALHSAVHDDVIVFGFGFTGDSIMRESLELLNGSSSKKGMSETRRFRKAFDDLPAAEDTLVFFDVDRMLESMSTTFGAALTHQGKDEPATKPRSKEIMGLQVVNSLIKDLSIIDFVAETERTDGYRTFTDSVTVLKETAKDSPLFGILAGQRPIKRFETYIPKEAQSFSVSSGISLSKTYDYLVDFFEKNVPDGKEKVDGVNKRLNKYGLNLKKDLLDLIEGTSVSVSTGKEWAFLVRVNDEEGMEKQVSKMVKTIDRLLGGMMGQENLVVLIPIDVGAEREFQKLSVPILAGFGMVDMPVYGCTDGQLIVGSSARAIRRCLDTARGERENITKSKRWREEGLAPEGPVVSISFTDERNWGQVWQDTISAVVAQIAVMKMMMMPSLDPKQSRALDSILPILQKAGPVIGKINFYKSSASCETFDGRTWRQRSVQNYKTPSAVPKESVDSAP